MINTTATAATRTIITGSSDNAQAGSLRGSLR
jgi:hypothetical protein